ncbi:MAG: spondin domain-containing protein, partial [Gammaproteobacteria bacterium]
LFNERPTQEQRMKRQLLALIIALAGGLASGLPASGFDLGKHFEVTITNLTRGQQFTPILVATHKAGVKLFVRGQPASPELAILAEEGDTAPLTGLLAATPEVLDITNSGALLNPGASVTLRVKTRGAFKHLSVASMLIPTNDGFFALNGVKGPKGFRKATHTSVAYDAGSERNDELCASIPGPSFVECDGPGGGGKPTGDEEGYVHIHAGIHGIGDLNAAERDWRNPVAQIVIRRVR